MTHEEIIRMFVPVFDELKPFFEGDSRILKVIPDHPDLLLSRLKPTIFSMRANGVVPLSGIDLRRATLDGIFSGILRAAGIQTSTLAVLDAYVLMKKESVPPIEIVVKGAFIGSPKHIYKRMLETPTRFGNALTAGERHEPYVRFDWRNPLPDEDLCMPEGLADLFIDVTMAKRTALAAFQALRFHLRAHQLDLLDICFFMSTDGMTVCAETSTDNTNIVYSGIDVDVREVFSGEKKEQAIERADKIIRLLTE
ncbi:hypothetical protein A2348_03615 [Candidatus Uhrbacteria bacterium RIFOXYB12_FULL_58_10]|uniref:Uncharacterized protein n=1 Tax=Candidatus Uhrbacteria bacterium RIFOXYB2_FULL_57_15 TaxID=1802422 RepID=A0A1F7W622_9BACT|nr:MAG: hypothetical protein A2348_03615 [Candidatus Uhrbacteria bacterium RIFOXYB12_FULL_58_10]OGL98262.1 MAG: hypothetical protein A2304_00225 [Candidatus Uhrbacteria bacterium RIFOXYB2_FULL_57_15]OGL98950.1 MAG: hypothetical protein A2501_02370 [Candidatus Uhrbacteria bacterium RIFOXYC12_FULL_57_11]